MKHLLMRIESRKITEAFQGDLSQLAARLNALGDVSEVIKIIPELPTACRAL